MTNEKIVHVFANDTFDLIPEGSQLEVSSLAERGTFGLSPSKLPERLKELTRIWTVGAPKISFNSEYGVLKLRLATTVGLGYANASNALDPFQKERGFNSDDLSLDTRIFKSKRNYSEDEERSLRPTLAIESYRDESDGLELLNPENPFHRNVLAKLRLQVGFPEIGFESSTFEGLNREPLSPQVRFFSFYPIDTGPLPKSTKRSLYEGYHFVLPQDRPIPLVQGRLYFID